VEKSRDGEVGQKVKRFRLGMAVNINDWCGLIEGEKKTEDLLGSYRKQ